MIKIDVKLWKECKAVIPKKKPSAEELPFLCGVIQEGMEVYLVNGDIVKVDHYMDFVEAGNDQRYHFIPRGQYWLDDNIELHDQAFNLYHEATERPLMANGMSYDKAHNIANEHEKILRKQALKEQGLID